MTEAPEKKPWLPAFLLQGRKLLLVVHVPGPKGDAGVVFVDRERWIVAFREKGKEQKVWREEGDGSFVDALYGALDAAGRRPGGGRRQRTSPA